LNTQEPLDIRGNEIFMLILQGSKLVGSKCKVARFYYIIPKDKAASDKLQICQTLAASVRKTLASGKQGEAGVKQLPDCSFICPGDTINDNMKVLDEAINSN
jgi:enolase